MTTIVYLLAMTKSNYLRALMQKDLSAIRRALFHERLLKRASGKWPAIPPEQIDGDAAGEQQRSADRIPGVGSDGADHDVERGEQE